MTLQVLYITAMLALYEAVLFHWYRILLVFTD